MDGQGDGWHNGPNSIRLPLPRGLRPPNDEPNMEFIAILDFIVNQEIIFVNEPEQWDLDDNQNNNPIHINNVNMEDNNNQPHDAVHGAEVQMEVNQRLEAVEQSSEQSRDHSTNDDDDEIRRSEHIRRSSTLDNTSDSNTDVDESNREPRPGPSWQRSEDDDEDEDRTRRNMHFPWWHEFHQKSSDSSPDFDFYEVNPLLCGSNQSLDSQDENGEMESKASGEFSTTAICATDLDESIINSDPAREVSDCEERLKDFMEEETEHEPVLVPFIEQETEHKPVLVPFIEQETEHKPVLVPFIEQETEHEPVLVPFRKCSKGNARCQIEKPSSDHCQRCHGYENNISEKSSDQDDPEENSLAGGSNQGSQDDLDSVETLQFANDLSGMPECDCEPSDGIRTSCAAENEGVSSDEDPQPGPSSRISRNEAGHHLETINTKRLRWWHEFCANNSDSSTDLEDAEGVSLPGASRKRCGDDDEEQTETRTSKRVRFGNERSSDEVTDGDEAEEERSGLNKNMDSHDTKGKKRLRWQADFSVRRKCNSNSSHCIKNGPQEFAVGFSDQEAQDDPQAAPPTERLRLERRCVKGFQVGHGCHHNSSDSTDSDSAEAEPLKLSLRDNLALLSLSSHVPHRKRKTVRFQDETSCQASDQDVEDDPPPTQSHETLSENANSSDKQ